MPIGVIINSSAVVLGGLVGAGLGTKLPERLKTTLNLMFGLASLSMGISYIGKMNTLPAVVLSVIVGAGIGELIYFEQNIGKGIGKLRGPLGKIMKTGGEGQMSMDEYLTKFISIVVLFCASGTGIYGALESGMTGDHTTLIAKSILDFFTAAIFATNLGALVSLIAIPQCIIMMLLYFGAGAIIPFTTDVMIADFTACGGFLMVATGLRICGIKQFPVANMIPAMIIVMPISAFWLNYIVPLVS